MSIIVDNKLYQTMIEIEDIVFLKRLGALNYNRTKTAKSLGKSTPWVREKISRLKTLGHNIPDNPEYFGLIPGSNAIH